MSQIQRRSLLGAGIALAGLAGRGARAAEAEGLVLYNGQHRTTTEALVAAFTKATGIKVTVRNAESPQLASQIIEEGARSPADLFYSEQSPPIAAVDARGLLAPIDAATLAQVPKVYAAGNGNWVGGSVRTRVVIYNKKMITPDQLPKSVLDFASDAWKDRIAYVPHDGFQEQIVAIVKEKGRPAALAWLQGLKKNARFYNSNTAARRAVEAGEIPAALTNNYYWYTQARETGADKMNSALFHVAPTDVGALRTISAAGILKTTKHPAEAQRFIAFMVSREGQQAIVNSVAEYSVRPDVASPFSLPPLDSYANAPITMGEVGAAEEAYALEREAGIA